MKRIQGQGGGRPGAISAFAAIMLVFLLGMVAFAIDIGYIVVTQTDLQNAADAAALAGAQELMAPFVEYQLPGQSEEDKDLILSDAMTAARDRAIEYAGYNAAGNVKSLTLQTADVTFGFTDAAGDYTPLADYDGFPNTVTVRMRRDGSANGALPLFLAPVLGTNTTSLSANASATIYAGVVNTLSTYAAGMLPMTYDVDHWNNFLNTGQDPDGSTSTASNGYPQLQVYPSVRAPGNFGLLSLDGYHASANDLDNWIHNGIGQDEIDSLIDLGLIPLSQHDANTWDWNGTTGFKASNVMDVNQHEGEVYLLPLFKAFNAGTVLTAGNSTTSVETATAAAEPAELILFNKGKGNGNGNGNDNGGSTSGGTTTGGSTSGNGNSGGNGNGNGNSSADYQAGVGNGSHYYYNIVQFVGIRIMHTSDRNRDVIVQPAAYIVPPDLLTSVAPAGTHGSLVTTFTAPRLSK